MSITVRRLNPDDRMQWLPLWQGYRAMLDSKVADTNNVSSGSQGGSITAALFLRAARAGLDIAEIPSRELPRNAGESNLRTFRDGGRVLGAIARERARRHLGAEAA